MMTLRGMITTNMSAPMTAVLTCRKNHDGGDDDDDDHGAKSWYYFLACFFREDKCGGA